MSVERDLVIQWLPNGGIKTNGREHYLPFVPEDQREHFARVLMRVYTQGKNMRSYEFKQLLEGYYP